MCPPKGAPPRRGVRKSPPKTRKGFPKNGPPPKKDPLKGVSKKRGKGFKKDARTPCVHKPFDPKKERV